MPVLGLSKLRIYDGNYRFLATILRGDRPKIRKMEEWAVDKFLA
jgi:hypothetical protein